MITFKGKKYSVPTKFIGKKVIVLENLDFIQIYYTKDLIVTHRKSEKILHYKYDHVKEILKSDALKNFKDFEIDDFIKDNLSTMDIFLNLEDQNEYL